MAEMLKLYKFQTNFPDCMSQKKLFGNNKGEYDRHFKAWLDWLISYIGNANVKVDGNSYTVSFKRGDSRFKAEWIEY